MEIGVGFVRSEQADGNNFNMYTVKKGDKSEKETSSQDHLWTGSMFLLPLLSLVSAAPMTNRNLSRIVAHYVLRSRCRWYGSWKSPAPPLAWHCHEHEPSNMGADGADTSIKRTAKHLRKESPCQANPGSGAS